MCGGGYYIQHCLFDVMDDLVAALPGIAFISASVVATAAQRLRSVWRREAVRVATAAVPRLHDWEELTTDDLRFIEATRRLLRTVPRPVHSDFLVCATLAYTCEGDADGAPLRTVCGVNTETCVLPSAICAERCALVQLRLRAPPLPRDVVGVYITTTATASGALITPGVLCREMLHEFGSADTRVVLFSGDWLPGVDETGGHSSRVDARGASKPRRRRVIPPAGARAASLATPSARCPARTRATMPSPRQVRTSCIASATSTRSARCTAAWGGTM